MASTVINGASVISAKIRTACLSSSTGLQSCPKKAGKSFKSIGPRITGIPVYSLTCCKSPRHKPGTIILSTPCKLSSRRISIWAVIKAATLTPILRISKPKPVGCMPARTFESLFSASLPVRNRICCSVVCIYWI